ILAELEVVDEDLEGALAATVVELGTGRVEGVSVVATRHIQHLVTRHVEDLRLGIDVATDQPGASDAIGLGPLAGHPFHRTSSCLESPVTLTYLPTTSYRVMGW